MTPRSSNDDQAMRQSINNIVAQFNEALRLNGNLPLDSEQFAAFGNNLQMVWETCFNDGFIETDGDIVNFLSTLPDVCWPRDLLYRARIQIADYLNQPVVAQRTSPLNHASRHLLDKRHDDTSQAGENGVIARALDILGIENRWCVEFGAADGKFMSNTYGLLNEEGWNGVLIEARGVAFKELQANYAGNDRVHLFHQIVGFDHDRNSIEYILAQTDAPTDLDLMVIDIDGNDWHIWRSMEKYRPRLMVVEFNPTVPNDVIYIQERDPAIQRGCSLSALIELGKAKGYEFVAATLWNGFFVLKEEFAKFGIEDNSIDAMYRPYMDGRIFHCYDSTVHTVGVGKMIWDGKGLGRNIRGVVPDLLHVHHNVL